MKKYLSVLAVAAMTAYATSAFSQGTVDFKNGTGLVQLWTGGGTAISIPKGGGFVQLFWAPTGTAYTPWNYSLSGAQWFAANPGWVLQNPTAPTPFATPTAGKFAGGDFTLQPLAPGATIDYVILAWTGSAASFDAALIGGSMVGVSTRYTSATGNPTTDPPGSAIPLSLTFTGMVLQIPEPSCLALATLGATTLFALRRRD